MIIKQAAVDGVKVTLSPTGAIKAIGNTLAIARWVPTLRDHKLEILAALQDPANDAEPLDIFAPALIADPDVHRRWIVTIPGRDPFVVIVSPDANIGQMRLKYSTATSIEPDIEV